jgi:4-hydroxybenzoate polyprenyltransferase
MKARPGNFLIPFLRLIRWPNLLMVAFTQSMIFYVLIGSIYRRHDATPALGPYLFILLVFTTVFISAAGYIINDYFDVRTDRINKPHKLVIGKSIPRRKAIKLHIIINSIVIIAGFWLSWNVGSFRLGLLFPIGVITLWFYSERFKRQILVGNLAVAVMSAMVVLVVWLFEFFALRLQPDKFMAVYTSIGLVSGMVLAYVGFAFLLTFVREIVKDVEDLEGDASTGCRTLPVVYGIGYAKGISLVLLVVTLLSVVFCSFWLYTHAMQVPSWYFGLFVCLPVLVNIYLVFKSRKTSDYHRISTLLKITMLAGILGLIPLAIYL